MDTTDTRHVINIKEGPLSLPLLSNENYRSIVSKMSTVVLSHATVSELDCKWLTETYDTINTVRMLNYNVQFHGHSCIQNLYDIKPDYDAHIDNHVFRPISRFKNISSWDVTNEVLQRDNSNAHVVKALGGIEVMLNRVFRTARKANPNATLWLSEYGPQNKRWDNYTMPMIKRLIDIGVPIDGVAVQLRRDVGAVPRQTTRRIQVGNVIVSAVKKQSLFTELTTIPLLKKIHTQLQELGVQFKVSEITMWLGPSFDNWDLVQQSVYYKQVIHWCEDNGVLWSMWDWADAHQYDEVLNKHTIKTDSPGIYDLNLKPKLFVSTSS